MWTTWEKVSLAVSAVIMVICTVMAIKYYKRHIKAINAKFSDGAKFVRRYAEGGNGVAESATTDEPGEEPLV